jgi:glycosyltransferase involved in cell wall biosynthesis
VLLSRPYGRWNPMALPGDVPRYELPCGPDEPWGSRWRMLIGYLESQAPCVYLPNYDYENSGVAPKLSAGVAIVGIIHSDDPDHHEHVARLGRFWDAVVAVSPALALSTLERQPALAGRLTTIPYGVPLPDAQPERAQAVGAPLRVVYAGRLEQQQKRVLDLPPIVERLLARGVPVELSVVGDGQCREELTRAFGPLVERGVVRFLGTQSNAAVLQLFEKSDAVVLPSAFEGLPVCLLEAMGRGCVPVVTDLRSGIPELIDDGANGFRVAVGDTSAFADRLALLHSDLARRRAMARAAFRTVRERGYDAERMAERYLELFDGVVARARARQFRRPGGLIRYPPGMPEASWKDQLPPRLRELGTRVMRALRRAAPHGRAVAS